jgi:hypothetical protein
MSIPGAQPSDPFPVLSPSALAEIGEFGTEIEVSAGQFLFQAGEASYDLFVVLEARSRSSA